MTELFVPNWLDSERRRMSEGRGVGVRHRCHFLSPKRLTLTHISEPQIRDPELYEPYKHMCGVGHSDQHLDLCGTPEAGVLSQVDDIGT